MSPAEIIQLLELTPHPEGGHYRETWRASEPAGSRAVGTAIYYLLEAGEVSRWHRIDADETWHWYAGSSLALKLSPDGRQTEALRLGSSLADGERPQILVPAGVWQSAHSLGPWTLAGCTVSPGFVFETFELAPAGWEPGTR
jgi:predicted cupin superfamily sugar epimerase